MRPRKRLLRFPSSWRQDDDPVGAGFVASLARPGGNVTGLATLAPELSGKRLELLKEIVPKLSRVARSLRCDRPGIAQALKEINVAAGAFGVKLQYLRGTRSERYRDGIPSRRARSALTQFSYWASGVLIRQRKRIADLAVKSRLPSMYSRPEYVEAGGLMFYGADYADIYRRVATYVDKILKGAKPADLPVEQPTKFELVINLKTAKQIGLTIPPKLLRGRIG